MALRSTSPQLVQTNPENPEQTTENTNGVEWYKTELQWFDLTLEKLAFNEASYVVSELYIEEKGHFGHKKPLFINYFVKEFFRDEVRVSGAGDFDPAEQVIYGMALRFSERILVEHEQSQIIASFASIGSYLSVVMSVWGVSTALLRIKYMNRQSKLVERYEEIKLNSGSVVKPPKPWFYFCSPRFCLSWCFQTAR